MIHNNFCFSCRSQMMPPRSSRLFFVSVACFMYFVFGPSVQLNVQEKIDLEQKLVSCISDYFLEL